MEGSGTDLEKTIWGLQFLPGARSAVEIGTPLD